MTTDRNADYPKTVAERHVDDLNGPPTAWDVALWVFLLALIVGVGLWAVIR